MKERLIIIAKTIVLISAIGLSILGLYHSKKHSDGKYIYSPFALYRGVEYFFHNDLEDWRAELKNVVLVINNMEYKNSPEFDAEFKEFKKRIDDFPVNGKDYLREFADDFLEYRLSWIDDFSNSIINSYWGTKLNFVVSAKTKSLKNKLNLYRLEDQVEFEDEAMKEMEIMYNTEIETVPYNEYERIKTELPANCNFIKERYRLAHKKIFN